MSEALLASFARLPTTCRLLEALRPGALRKAGGLWGASAALVVATLRRETGRPLLVATAHDEDARTLAGDLELFGVPGGIVLVEAGIGLDGAADPALAGQRARALHAVHGQTGFVAIGSLSALLQAAPTPRAIAQGRLVLHAGTPQSRSELLQAALAAGLRKVPLLLAPGEVSLRGDVLDLWPFAAEHALRLEFCGDVLESLRPLDPATQLSAPSLPAAEVVLGGGAGAAADDDAWLHFHRNDLLLVRYEPLRIADRHVGRDPLLAAAEQRLVLATTALPQLELSALPSHDVDFRILSAGSSVGSGEADPKGRIQAIRGSAGSLCIVCRSEAERDRLVAICAHKGIDLARERVSLRLGTISRGFSLHELGVTLLSNLEFAGVPAAARIQTRATPPSRAVQSFFELGPGDLVVHAVHGIARFLGMDRVNRGAVAEDHLRLLFADEVQLLVPASKIHLVQKYVGSGAAAPKLDKLGGRGFQRRKEEVQQALFDLAADLLAVQAERQRSRRPPYPRDPLEDQFLDAFPFADTPDQVVSWNEIRADLEQEQPMDRLLCGDVGFGKTELALRAAFKVAITGRQVAVLVPTTVLADQHAETFRARFAPHGLGVELLSRYRTAKERRRILADAALGRLDVLIGTHAILTEDLVFKALGLLVIDEEQRFGVRQKEQLKRLRAQVDVLTLSATPIPRTLHAALLGIRPISSLHTPPAGREAIETRLLWREPEILGLAVGRELARGGQVFVLHNEIAALPAIAREIQRLVPAARIAIGHGQQSEREMEQTVRRFVHGEIDVLVSTTIVENGLDIPRANTILIDRADRFGLAELHQLRGRVGRSNRQAYCYLLIDRTAPPADEARRRLKAIEELSHLGAGFQIALKDLELRGAGNLLGPQQSGHIAAVGYDMYCKLLAAAVAQVQHTLPEQLAAEREVDVDLRIDAYVPDELAADARLRLEILREMDEARSESQRAAIATSLRDRFGTLPRAVENLLDVFLLKHLLEPQGVLAVQLVAADRVVVHHPAQRPLGGAWLEAFADVRQVEAGKTHLLLPPPAARSPADALQHLLAALLGRADAAMIRKRWSAAQRPPPRSLPS